MLKFPKKSHRKHIKIPRKSIRLAELFGIIFGDGGQRFGIPRWIERNSGFEKAFVRGLMDTDGCFYTHRYVVCNKNYYNLGLCFASFSQKLIESVARIFIKNGIEPHFANKRRWICLYSNVAQQTYLRVFGSSNPRIFEKRRHWEFWRGVRVV